MTPSKSRHRVGLPLGSSVANERTCAGLSPKALSPMLAGRDGTIFCAESVWDGREVFMVVGLFQLGYSREQLAPNAWQLATLINPMAGVAIFGPDIFGADLAQFGVMMEHHGGAERQLCIVHTRFAGLVVYHMRL